MRTIVYGIPTCGTVRKARQWLAAQKIAYDWVDMRVHPPDRLRIAAWVAALGFKALRNTSGGAYRALGDEKRGWDAEQWTEAFASDAMLIRRPVVEVDGVPVLVGFREAAWTKLAGEKGILSG